jgi:hypothetical protein
LKHSASAQPSPRTSPIARLSFFAIALASTLVAACAGIRVRPQPADVARVGPDDPPAPPHEPDSTYPEAMNTEYCLGSCAEEESRFRDFGKQIMALQQLQTSRRDQSVARGFHAKGHACLHGSIEVHPARAPRTRFGIFAEGATTFPVWVRYSNGVGWTQADDKLDARGMAVKVMGVKGERLTMDELETQDFLMTNSPTPVGRNAEEFMKFAHANESGFLSGLGFLVSHPNTGAPALTRTGAITSTVNESYYSGSAYHWGAHQAVKYAVKPCKGVSPRAGGSHDDPNYLRNDLRAAAKEGICYTLYVQFQVDPDSTPIEHASREWREDVSPFVPVADIKLPSQSFDDERRSAFCEQLSFNPWHGIRQHQPMGHINRARRVVYYSSAFGRSSGKEPHGFEGFDQATPPAAAPVAPAASAPVVQPGEAGTGAARDGGP